MTSDAIKGARSRALAGLLIAALISIGTLPEAAAQSQMAFPGSVPGKDVVRSQEKAELAFESGDYDRAFWFYRKELAPIGDKYAQYMVGYMTYHGLGVPRDEVQGAAWFSLAAERGHKQIVELVEQYRSDLTPEQLQEAVVQANELKSELGDVALVKVLIRRDLRKLRESAGSRLGSRNCNRIGRVVSVEFGSIALDRYCELLNRRIDARVAYIGGYVEYGELVLLPDENDGDDNGDDASSGEADTE